MEIVALFSAAFNILDIHHTQVVPVRIHCFEEDTVVAAASAGAEAGQIVAAEVGADRTVAVVGAGHTVAEAGIAASAAEAEVGCTAAAAGPEAGCTDLGAWIVPDSTSRFGCVRRFVLQNAVGPREPV